ncbi:MAG: hypothetical protein HC927_09945, partial [Deltaproteobacteria bacterium]|nr:hypothetical protein [Deltaproteobacteria bacterium]
TTSAVRRSRLPCWRLESGIRERRVQLERFVVERGGVAPRFEVRDDQLPRCPWVLGPSPDNHVHWVRSLSEGEVEEGKQWLATVTEIVRAAAEDELRRGAE